MANTAMNRINRYKIEQLTRNIKPNHKGKNSGDHPPGVTGGASVDSEAKVSDCGLEAVGTTVAIRGGESSIVGAVDETGARVIVGRS